MTGKNTSRCAVGLILALALGGCTGDGAIGSASSGDDPDFALIGALIDDGIVEDLDDADAIRAIQAERHALNGNRSVSWRSPDRAFGGTVTPLRTYVYAGRNCREYTHVVFAGGLAQEARGVACQQPDGRWRLVS